MLKRIRLGDIKHKHKEKKVMHIVNKVQKAGPHIIKRLLIDEEDVLVDGYHRLIALKELYGDDYVIEVIVVENLTC